MSYDWSVKFAAALIPRGMEHNGAFVQAALTPTPTLTPTLTPTPTPPPNPNPNPNQAMLQQVQKALRADPNPNPNSNQAMLQQVQKALVDYFVDLVALDTAIKVRGLGLGLG